MSDDRSQQEQGQRDQGGDGQKPPSVPMEKPFVERMKPYLQGVTQEPQILDPANPNLRQPVE